MNTLFLCDKNLTNQLRESRTANQMGWAEPNEFK
jgi:hypothetical protein